MTSIDIVIEILKANGYRFNDTSRHRSSYCYTGHSKDDRSALSVTRWDGEPMRISIRAKKDFPEFVMIWRAWSDPKIQFIDLRDPNSIDEIVKNIGMSE